MHAESIQIKGEHMHVTNVYAPELSYMRLKHGKTAACYRVGGQTANYKFGLVYSIPVRSLARLGKVRFLSFSDKYVDNLCQCSLLEPC